MKKIVISTIVFIILSNALDFDALNHNPDNIFYANPWMGEIKLRVSKGTVLEAFVIYANKRTKMTLGFQDNRHDYFTADVGKFDTTFNYQILVRDKTDSLFLPQIGTFKCLQQPFIIPEWAYSKVYYSIFPDGFYNANKTNDPKNVAPWGKIPDREYSYGGDLLGIIEKLPYLDSLDFDILLLQPILSANSNHKYDLRDYANLDIHLGDTIELKNLINEIHLRKKRIILKFIVTHTGTDFASFQDVIKNGSASKYYNWYFIHSLPVKTSPPNYDCWLNDARFPKLNLKEPSVQAFLIGYIDYWLHFGFDGVYIGEDFKIDPDFVRILKNSLKRKYPELLVLGSSENFGINGFDGTANKKIADLIMNYFIHNKISTSEFDSELKKILFFMPSQINLTNLIDLSDFNIRISNIASIDNLLLLNAFLFTFCGSPVLTYGDEVGMKDGQFLNMGSFPWEYEKQNRSLFEEIKKLITIRKNNPILNNKYYYTLYVNDINRVYAYDRGGIIVIINSGDSQSYTVLPVWNGTYTNLMTGEKMTVATQQLRLSLPAKSFKILKREI
ncbi:MAG: alpha-amylase family glycosyl hydrolase [candidate division WOR-3 bacterium]